MVSDYLIISRVKECWYLLALFSCYIVSFLSSSIIYWFLCFCQLCRMSWVYWDRCMLWYVWMKILPFFDMDTCQQRMLLQWGKKCQNSVLKFDHMHLPWSVPLVFLMHFWVLSHITGLIQIHGLLNFSKLMQIYAYDWGMGWASVVSKSE